MTLHPSAWVAWLTAVAIFAFVVTNPFYLVLALGAVLVVHLSFPSEAAPVARAVRMFLMFGIVLLLLRLVFVALLPNPGKTVLVTLPLVELPRFLGALRLGGPVSAEVLVYGAIEGFRLVIVLAAFGVFNARADVSALVRSVPAAFRDVGLVVSIALAFVPGMLRTVRDVRDAQRLRGERGLRRLAPSLAVPVLGLSLERALLLAESMDARGYGYGGESRTSRGVLLGGLAAMLASVAAWVAGFRSAATVLAVGGAILVIAGFRSASAGSRTTRLGVRPVRVFDLVVIVASAAVLVLVLLAPADATYDPYPLAAPAFSWQMAALTFLMALPAVAGAESR